MKQPSGEPATAASDILLSNTLLILFMWAMKLYAEHTKMHHFHVEKIKKKFWAPSPDPTPVENGASQETRLLS